jgi:hypothetical protein
MVLWFLPELIPAIALASESGISVQIKKGKEGMEYPTAGNGVNFPDLASRPRGMARAGHVSQDLPIYSSGNRNPVALPRVATLPCRRLVPLAQRK